MGTVLTRYAFELITEINNLIESCTTPLSFSAPLQITTIPRLLQNKGNTEDFNEVYERVKEWGQIKFAPEFVTAITDEKKLEQAKKNAQTIITFREIADDIKFYVLDREMPIKKIFEQ